jgi:4-hydroxythreonine-4-phosphate dehydrogenase
VTRKPSQSGVTLVVSTGCPAGVGPEVSVAAAASVPHLRSVLVGDERTLHAAAELVGVSTQTFALVDESLAVPESKIGIFLVGPPLKDSDRKPGKPSRVAGAAQLGYVAAAYELAKVKRGAALVSGPVSKAAIAGSGARGARGFLGHTEWLRDRDEAPYAIMCFAAPRLATSLVTTHLPLSKVPRALTREGVRDSTVELVRLLHALGKKKPTVAVASLNPHAGESELLGKEESTAILPGIELARAVVGKTATLVGPTGAETAYRLTYAGTYDGVVAMYHDQATIPMKLVAFGDAVNITMGLGVVRTSVDHGTGYDIAWTGKADASGMVAAMRMGEVLAKGRARSGQ